MEGCLLDGGPIWNMGPANDCLQTKRIPLYQSGPANKTDPRLPIGGLQTKRIPVYQSGGHLAIEGPIPNAFQKQGSVF